MCEKMSYRDALLKSSYVNEKKLLNYKKSPSTKNNFTIDNTNLTNLTYLKKIPIEYLTGKILFESLRKLNKKLNDFTWDCVSMYDEDITEYTEHDFFKQLKDCIDYFETLYSNTVSKEEYEQYLNKFSYVPITKCVRIIPEWVEIDDSKWSKACNNNGYNTYLKK